MWLDISSPHPDYVARLIEALLGIPQPSDPDDCAILDRSGLPVGRIRKHEKSMTVPYFDVACTESAIAAALASSTPVEAAGRPPGGKALLLSDPQGAVFGIYHDPPQSAAPSPPHEPGFFAELNAGPSDLVRNYYKAILGAELGDLRPLEGASEVEEFSPYHLIVRESEVLGAIADAAAGPWTAPRWVTYLDIAETQSAAATAIECGCRVIVPPTPSPMGVFAVIEDPYGLVLGLGCTGFAPDDGSFGIEMGGQVIPVSHFAPDVGRL